MRYTAFVFSIVKAVFALATALALVLAAGSWADETWNLGLGFDAGSSGPMILTALGGVAATAFIIVLEKITLSIARRVER